MRSRTLVLAAALLGLGPLSPLAAAAQTATDTVYQYILDYDVPESPAFAALGVTASNVLRGSAAKPIVASVLTDALESGKTTGGLALDFSPMIFAKPTFTSFNAYRASFAGRVLRRLSLSLGSIQNEQDTTSLRLGGGIRFTFIDENDPLMSTALFNAVDSLLQLSAPPAPRPGQATGVGSVITVSKKEQIAEAYSNARKQALARRGWAVSAGWGIAAVLRGSALDPDSIRDAHNNLWVGGRYKFSTPASVVFTAQWREIPGEESTLRGGVGLRAEMEGVSGAAEVVYDSFTGTLQPGGSAEIRLVRGTRIVLGIVSEPPRSGTDSEPRLRLKTLLKWNFAELQRD